MPMAKKKYYQRPDGLYEAIRVVNGKRKAFRGRTPHEVEQKMIAYPDRAWPSLPRGRRGMGGRTLPHAHGEHAQGLPARSEARR